MRRNAHGEGVSSPDRAMMVEYRLRRHSKRRVKCVYTNFLRQRIEKYKIKPTTWTIVDEPILSFPTNVHTKNLLESLLHMKYLESRL